VGDVTKLCCGGIMACWSIRLFPMEFDDSKVFAGGEVRTEGNFGGGGADASVGALAM
jgi:hypothetical protein